MERRRLIVFSKPAVPGRVKTRLLSHLTAEHAAELHAALLGDLVEALAEARFDWAVSWLLAEGEAVPGGVPAAPPQVAGDLGERLYAALASAAADGDRVAVVGSDLPGFRSEIAERAFAALDAADLVVVPAPDGGYSMIAVRAAGITPEIFRSIDWSTPAVLAQTEARAASLGLRVAFLEPLADLDTPADLEALGRRLAADARAAGPRVRGLMESWGRLGAPIGP